MEAMSIAFPDGVKCFLPCSFDSFKKRYAIRPKVRTSLLITASSPNSSSIFFSAVKENCSGVMRYIGFPVFLFSFISWNKRKLFPLPAVPYRMVTPILPPLRRFLFSNRINIVGQFLLNPHIFLLLIAQFSLLPLYFRLVHEGINRSSLFVPTHRSEIHPSVSA